MENGFGKKLCRKCGEFKNPEEFGVDNNAKDGHRRQCKECRNAAGRKPAGIAHHKIQDSLKMDKIIENISIIMNNQEAIMLFLKTLKLSNAMIEIGKTASLVSELSDPTGISDDKPKVDKFPIKGLSVEDLKFLGMG